MSVKRKGLYLLILFVVELDKRLIYDSGYRFAGIPIKHSDENRNNGQAARLEAVGVVDVTVYGGSAADIIVRPV